MTSHRAGSGRTTRSGRTIGTQQPSVSPVTIPPGSPRSQGAQSGRVDTDIQEQIADATRRERQLQAEVELAAIQRRITELEQVRDAQNSLPDDIASQIATASRRMGASPPPAATTTATRKSLNHPKEYYGKHLKEHQEFVYRCEINFRRDLSQFPDDESQVLYGASFLKGEPMERWRTHEGAHQHNTWKEFKRYLLDLIMHPENRRLDMEYRLAHAHQRQGQSVKDFISYLEGIFPFLPGYTDSQKQSCLLHGLKASIRQTILSQPVVNHTYEGLQRYAERLEMQGSLARTIGGEPSNHHSKPSVDRRPRQRSRSPDRRASGSNATPLGRKRKHGSHRHRSRPRNSGDPSHEEPWSKKPNDLSHIECYNCHRKGHYANKCPDADNSKPKNGKT
jgi:hypothetical protein